jgi:CheY-like chemotaxis protein
MQKEKILVVDDNPDILMSARFCLNVTMNLSLPVRIRKISLHL